MKEKDKGGAIVRLTSKKSVELSIELWKWLAETGKLKVNWPGWKDYRYMRSDCFMCDYSSRRCKKGHIADSCVYCPYYIHYKRTCIELGVSSYDIWYSSSCIEDRIKYAKLFLAELEGIVIKRK